MITTLIASTLLLSAQAPAEAAPAPELTLQQRTGLRCGTAFALVSYGQDIGNEAALAYPDLAQRGKEFFVRVSAQAMDEAGLDRQQIAAIVTAEAQSLSEGDALAAIMPGCLALLDASGL